MGIGLSGLVSGLDTEGIIEALMSTQRLKATKIENKITTNEWKTEKWKDLNKKIYSLYTGPLYKMKVQGNYLAKKTSSSNESIVTAKASSSAPLGTHTITVESTASAQYVTGTELDQKGLTKNSKLSEIGDGVKVGTVIEMKCGDKSKRLEVKADTTINDFLDACKDAGLNANFDTARNCFYISSKQSGQENYFTITTQSYSDDDLEDKMDLENALGYANMSKEDQEKIDEALEVLRGLAKEDSNPDDDIDDSKTSSAAIEEILTLSETDKSKLTGEQLNALNAWNTIQTIGKESVAAKLAKEEVYGNIKKVITGQKVQVEGKDEDGNPTTEEKQEIYGIKFSQASLTKLEQEAEAKATADYKEAQFKEILTQNNVTFDKDVTYAYIQELEKKEENILNNVSGASPLTDDEVKVLNTYKTSVKDDLTELLKEPTKQEVFEQKYSDLAYQDQPGTTEGKKVDYDYVQSLIKRKNAELVADEETILGQFNNDLVRKASFKNAIKDIPQDTFATVYKDAFKDLSNATDIDYEYIQNLQEIEEANLSETDKKVLEIYEKSESSFKSAIRKAEEEKFTELYGETFKDATVNDMKVSVSYAYIQKLQSRNDGKLTTEENAILDSYDDDAFNTAFKEAQKKYKDNDYIKSYDAEYERLVNIEVEYKYKNSSAAVKEYETLKAEYAAGKDAGKKVETAFEDPSDPATNDINAQIKAYADIKLDSGIVDGQKENGLKALGLQEITEEMATGTEIINGLARAADAKVNINGKDFEMDSNTITVNGVTFDLKMAEPGKTVSITVTQDTDKVYDMVKDFVKQYNELLDEMNTAYYADSAYDYDPLTDEQKDAMSEKEIENWENKIKGSLLRRDNTLGSLTSAMRSCLSGSIKVDDKTYSLASFGICTTDYTEKGKLHIYGDADDSAGVMYDDRLRAAIEEDPEVVMEVLQQLSENLYNTMTDKMKSSSLSSALTFYNDKQYAKELTSYKKELASLENRLKDIEDRYYKQFTAMEKALSDLNNNANSFASMLGMGQTQ